MKKRITTLIKEMSEGVYEKESILSLALLCSIAGESIFLLERYERKSVIIASQLPIAKWYDYIGDATLADAIMDRLVANANKIELKGKSMRQRKNK